jgi:hypothetical protein
MIVPGCGPTIVNPQLHAVEDARLLGAKRKPQPLKVHMLSGDLVVLDSWKVAGDGQALEGEGTRYTARREPVASGALSVPVAEVALLETTDSATAAVLSSAGLSLLTTIWGTLSVACSVSPKSCFGSCPTFYAEGDPDRPRAEGFSSSIARVLEARDLDALGDVGPRDGRVVILMKNEALETHAVRRVRVLAVERPRGARVFATGEGRFRATHGLARAASCRGPEGSCAEALALPDDRERRSASHPVDLAAREELELLFSEAPAEAGLVIRARQSLLTTFLFYQTLACLGRGAGAHLAAIERGGPAGAAQAMGMARVLGGIDVEVSEPGGPWRRAGAFDEAGPIASDTQVLPLGPRHRSGPLRVRLRMARGHWRVDWVALGQIGPELQPRVVEPEAVERDGRLDARALDLLRDGSRHLITLPGDEYRLSFLLPKGGGASELFVESEGYYYEWMREEWLREEDPAMALLIASRPEEALRRLAGPFKAQEAGADAVFWASRYERRAR